MRCSTKLLIHSRRGTDELLSGAHDDAGADAKRRRRANEGGRPAACS
jgi:hypothetical protein